jgi:hypothetical protein
MEIVKTLNGLELEMQLIKTYTSGKLFFSQERLCITDLNNVEINSLDIINYVSGIL